MQEEFLPIWLAPELPAVTDLAIANQPKLTWFRTARREDEDSGQK